MIGSLNQFLKTGEVVPALAEDYQSIVTREKDPTQNGLEKMPDNLYRKYCKKHFALMAHIDSIGLPAPGEQFRLVTRRSFNSMEFIDHIATRETIKSMHLAIYSINFQSAQRLLELIEKNNIQHAEILISNLRNGAHREKERVMRDLFVSNPKIDVFYASSHAKLFSCSTQSGNFYTVEGSGNMANNSRIEQYVIDNDPEIYEFTKKWMQEIREFLKGKKEFSE